MRRKAFTLIELLTVIAIVAILASLLMAAVTHVRQVANRSTATSQMRQIGVATMLYAQEHRNVLPGPLQAHVGTVSSPEIQGQYATQLAPYLDAPQTDEPYFVSAFLTPGVQGAMPNHDPTDIVPFLLNMRVKAENGLTFKPYGEVGDENFPQGSPLHMIPPDTWGFMETDQENPLVAGAPWAANAPEHPVHGPERLAWFFDGSVRPLPVDSLKPPPGGPGWKGGHGGPGGRPGGPGRPGGGGSPHGGRPSNSGPPSAK